MIAVLSEGTQKFQGHVQMSLIQRSKNVVLKKRANQDMFDASKRRIPTENTTKVFLPKTASRTPAIEDSQNI